MNLYILSLIHVIIWLFVLFSGFISYKLLILNIVIVLPLIYCSHFLPLHVIRKQKINFILENRDMLKKTDINYNDDKLCNLINEAKKLGYTTDEMYDIMKYMEYYSDVFILPKILKDIDSTIFKNSWKSPFTPQGLIVLAYIINVLLLKFKYKII